MIPIIRLTIWQRRWSIFWWSLGLVLLVVVTLAFYPEFKNQAQLDKSLSSIPATAKSFISDTNDFLSPVGYLSSQMFYLLLPLLLSVLSIGLGSSLIAREENDATIELLLARPISRRRYLAGKALAGGLILAAVSVVTTAVIILLSWLINIDVPLGYIALACLLLVVVAALFGALAFMITALGRRGRLASVGITALVAIGGYVINSLVSIASWLKWPNHVLPYYYYRPGDVLYGSYNWWNALGLALAALVLLAVASEAFHRRDIG